MEILYTARLLLRPSAPDDRTDFLALERDPEVMRHLNGGHAMTSEEPDPEADYFMPRGSEPHLWTACRQKDGTFIGWFGLWPSQDDNVAELGYRLKRSSWGEGYASEGASTLVAWGFQVAGYQRIAATTMAVNHASRRVMEKLGMQHVSTVPYGGRFPITGSEEGEVWYEIVRTHSSA